MFHMRLLHHPMSEIGHQIAAQIMCEVAYTDGPTPGPPKTLLACNSKNLQRANCVKNCSEQQL